MFKRMVIVLLVLNFSVVGCSGKSKEELYGEAVKQLEAGNANGAVVLLKNALEKDQNYTDARYQLAKAYLATQKFEQAEREFEKVVRQNPSRDDVKLELASLYNQTGKPDEAITQCNEYLKTHPDSVAALEGLGMSFALKKDLGQSEHYLQQAIRIDPANQSPRLQLARVYAATGRTGDARGMLEEVIKKDPKNTQAYYLLADFETSLGNKDKALHILQTIAEIDSSQMQALYRVGIIHLEKGETEKAAKIAADMMRRAPNNPDGHRLNGIVQYYKKDYDQAIIELQNSLKTRLHPAALYFLGLSHYSRKEYELALNQFQKVLDLSPQNSQSRLMVSVVLLTQKRFDDAVKEAQRVIQYDDNNAFAHNVLGSAYLAKGMSDEAMAEFNKATEINPKLLDAHLKKGLFNISRGNTREAESELQTAVQVAPDLLNTRYLLASYYMKQKNNPKAMKVLKEGLRGNSSDALVYNTMAAVAFGEKKMDEGVAYLKKAKELNPGYYAPYFNLAAYYVSKGEHDKALAEYRSVLEKDSGNALAMVRMAALFEQKGNKQEALKYYSKAKETRNSLGYMAMAEYHLRQKESSKALGVLNEAIKADAHNAAALELKGAIQSSEKNYQDAVKTYTELEQIAPAKALTLKTRALVLMKDIGKAKEAAQKIIALTPKSAYGHTVMASVYESQGDNAGAINVLREGLKVDPDNLQVKMAIGQLQVKKHDYAAALNTFEEVVRKSPKFIPALFAIATTYDVMGKKKEAAARYGEAVRYAPEFVPALNNLAILNADGYGKPAEGLKLATRAANLAPGNPVVSDTLGYVLLKNGQKEEARKHLEKAAAAMPDSPSVQYHLALACKALGDRARATQAVRKSLEHGDFPEAQAARQLLAELK